MICPRKAALPGAEDGGKGAGDGWGALPGADGLLLYLTFLIPHFWEAVGCIAGYHSKRDLYARRPTHLLFNLQMELASEHLIFVI